MIPSKHGKEQAGSCEFEPHAAHQFHKPKEKTMTQFTLQRVELLPPLKPNEVLNLIKFLQLNADRLADLSGYESCCSSDDADVLQGYVYDTLRLGYGTPEDLVKYNKDNFFEDDDDDDEDEDE